MNLHRTFSHFFTPHESNNHRAKVLHLDAMLFYVLAFAVFNFGLRAVSQSHPDILGFATNIQVQELLSATNAKRQEAGLSPLTLNVQLSQAAAQKAADMFSKNYWAHVSPDGKTPWDFILSSGYKYSVAGENLAKNFQDSSGVVNAWMASPSHRDNLMKASYKEVGFAVVNGKLLGEDTTLVVQEFGARSGKVVTQAPEEVVPQNPQTAPVIADVQPALDQPVLQQVVVPEVASVTETRTEVSVQDIPFASVLNLPKFDVVAIRRNVTFIFAGMLIGVLLLDLWVAAKKHTVRAVGSTVAHVFFFLAILLSTNIILHGSVL